MSITVGSLLDNYENKCMPVFDYNESDNPNTLFWNETRRFQRKLKRYDKENGSQNFIFSTGIEFTLAGPILAKLRHYLSTL